MRTTYDRRTFTFTNLPGFPWRRRANRWVIHTDGNPKPHTAAGALAWGDRTRAFNIHLYIEDELAYWCVPLDWQAFHVRRDDVAAARGFVTTLPGLTQKRGDIYANGSEHLMRGDGTWSQDTRITSILAHAEAFKANPGIGTVQEHAELDPRDRAFDVGDAVWVPDWILDVQDVVAGRTPFRTVSEPYEARPVPKAARPAPADTPPLDPSGDVRQQIADLADEVAKVTARLAVIHNSVEDALDAHVAWHRTAT